MTIGQFLYAKAKVGELIAFKEYDGSDIFMHVFAPSNEGELFPTLSTEIYNREVIEDVWKIIKVRNEEGQYIEVPVHYLVTE